MATTINTGSRTVSVGDRIINDKNIILDVTENDSQKTLYTNLPLVELLEALAKIPGVTAIYNPPQPTTWDKIQALGQHAVIRFTNYGTPETTTWSRRPSGEYVFFNGVEPLSEGIANVSGRDVIVEFEGVK